MRIGLIPLDERPVNTRYPVQIGRIAGAEVVLPPAEALSHFRTPGSFETLSAWMMDPDAALSFLIVSLEMLGFGGLIASRISHESLETILARLGLLRDYRQQWLNYRSIVGFNLITRVSRHNDATEEPLYWAQYGADLFRLSQLMDRASLGQPVEDELRALQARIPSEYVEDFLWRRQRNHAVNLAALALLAEGVLADLILSSDDTSDYGLGAQEKRVLQAQIKQRPGGRRPWMYPGADEVACLLVAREIVEWVPGPPPVFQVHYAVAGGEDVVAAFEDGPVSETIERQVNVVHGWTVQVGESFDLPPDVLLIINPPLGPVADWPRPYTDEERNVRLPQLEAAVNQIARALEDGTPVAIADVAHANGADNTFFDMLRAEIDLSRLAAYAAWNTAGNTIGTAIAQACAVRHNEIARELGGSDIDELPQQEFLVCRIVEDWAYQANVRDEVRDWLEAQTGRREPTAANLDETRAQIETRLQARLAQLPEFASWRITPGSVRLPWNRTFEIDFDVEKTV